tara:strand:- start:4285 stop:5517 length:1233 start_codon:yes stop_codon:yes gene_type:complete
MKLTIRTSFCLLFFSVCTFTYGQMEQYNYKRELKGISEQWHKIILPIEIYGETSQNLSDIRIFGVTKKDTLESPYLLRSTAEKISINKVAFKTLNASRNNKGYYYTFEIPTVESINQIKLQFKQQNFDWRVRLEGSQDQKEWFTVVNKYRILSIKNDLTNFQFTKLTFPSSKYRFFRMLIDSKERPKLTVASVEKHEITDGTFRKHSIKKVSIKENKKSKQTEIDIELQLPASVSRIKIDISDTFDYYRPLAIKYLIDSVKTEQGWKYNYSTFKTGTLNSLEENEFKFKSLTVQKLKIIIENKDNQPLSIGTIEVKGYIHQLVTRFIDQADYFLTYGNKTARKSQYDIERFINTIPNKLTALEVGNELILKKEKATLADPLFRNKIWLWSIMTLLILLLGWFSLKMMRKN